MGKTIKIGILTSGGDSPGMNCAIRAVVRTAISLDISVVAIYEGYEGIFKKKFKTMDLASVGNILQRGGTILKSSRSKKFYEEEGRKEAAEILKKEGINTLVVIGGDGSYNGAFKLHQEHGINVIAIPGTIDNDIAGTSYSIGFDSAVQTAIDAVDKIRDTASSHQRVFIVEVMGRRSAHIALHVGVSCGAENIVYPNQDVKYEEIISDVQRGINRGKDFSIIIVAEGKEIGRSYEIANQLKERADIICRVCILGHIQRGGSPTGIDRFIATRMGYEAVNFIANSSKKFAKATIFTDGKVQIGELSDSLVKKNEIQDNLVEMAKILSI